MLQCWMIWGYPHLRSPPNVCGLQVKAQTPENEQSPGKAYADLTAGKELSESGDVA